MLQGFAQKKLSAFVLNNHARRPIEDMMTAAILGSLAYMPTNWAAAVLQRIFSVVSEVWLARLDLGNVKKIELRLWPRKNGVEPDAVLTVHGSGVVRIIFEVKWNSDFSKRQALRQWSQFRDVDTFQLLLVRKFSDGTRHIADCLDPKNESSDCGGVDLVEWSDRVAVAGWDQVAEAIESLIEDGSDAPLHLWARDAKTTLELFGVHIFRGFNDQQCQGAGIVLPPDQSIFFRPIVWPSTPLVQKMDWRPCAVEGGHHSFIGKKDETNE